MPIKKAPKLKALKATAKDMPYPEKGATYDPRPCFSISETDLPEIKSWTIDGKYNLEIEVEMRGIREADYGNDKGKKIAEFRISKIGYKK